MGCYAESRLVRVFADKTKMEEAKIAMSISIDIFTDCILNYVVDEDLPSYIYINKQIWRSCLERIRNLDRWKRVHLALSQDQPIFCHDLCSRDRFPVKMGKNIFTYLLSMCRSDDCSWLVESYSLEYITDVEVVRALLDYHRDEHRSMMLITDIISKLPMFGLLVFFHRAVEIDREFVWKMFDRELEVEHRSAFVALHLYLWMRYWKIPKNRIFERSFAILRANVVVVALLVAVLFLNIVVWTIVAGSLAR